MRFLSGMFGRVCRDVGEGGSTGIGEEQLSFLEDMLDEPTGTDTQDEQDPPKDETEGKDTDPINQGGDPEPAEKVELSDKTDPEQDKGNETEQTIQSLREQILALTESLSKDPLQQSVQMELGTQAPEGVTDLKKGDSVLADFLSAEELDRLIDEPALINVAFQRSQTAMLQSVGALVANEVKKQNTINRVVSDFYSANEDLKPYAKFVQFVMAEVEVANKDKTYDVIFETTAKECRKRLGLATTPVQQRGNNQANNGQQRPAFVGSKRGNARPSGSKEIFDSNAADMF